MREIGNSLRVGFFEGNKPIQPREGYQYTKLNDDGSLYLDLTTIKGQSILKLLLSTNKHHIDGIVYKVIDKEYMIDGTALFIVLEKVE